MAIALASPPHDPWADEEDDGWKGEGQPEADVLLGVDHAQLTDQSTDVDEEIEVVVNARLSDRWVDDDTLTRWQGLDLQSLDWDLFHDERRNVWLEATGSDTHDDQSDNEGAE